MSCFFLESWIRANQLGLRNIMEATEIATLNYCSQDIRSKVFVSANVLQKLQYRGILSIEERQSIKVRGKNKLQ